MIERVMSELVENVGDHADVETTGRSPFSIAQLIITRGGGSASMDRFQMVVMDNGIGLPRSIRKRRSDLSGARAVEAALEGRLGVSQSDRNLGLRNVRSIIEGAPGSSFAILTGYREDKSRSISARVDDRGHVEVDELELPVFGTMAVAQIALPSVADDHPSLFDADPAELITVS